VNERLINEVALGVVFVQGPGEYLTITADERLDVAADIQEGCSLLTGLEPDAEISWTTRYEDVTLSQPIFPTAPWEGMPPSFYVGRIDAALWREENRRSYLFQGNQYLRLSGSTMEASYPKFIAAGWQGLPTAFESGIDAAFWRQSDGKIYLFKGSQYVRLTGTTTDAGFPRAIADDWHGLPDEFERDLDAAFMHQPDGGIYLFKGDQVVRLSDDTVDAGFPKKIADVFEGIPDEYASGIMASLWRGDNERLYLFDRADRNDLNTYVRFTDITQPIDDFYPKYVGGLAASETEALWRDPALAALGFGPGQGGYAAYVDKLMADAGAVRGYVTFITKYPTYWGAYAVPPKITMRLRAGETSRDRVFAHESGHIFGAPDEYASSNCECGKRSGRFFSVANGNCRLCANPAMDDGQPESIASEWFGLPANFQSGIEAAVWRYDNKRAYLFKGNYYVKLNGHTIEPGYPKPIAGNWNGLPSDFEEGIDAALWRRPIDKLYFFKGSQYVRLTGSTVDATYPKPIAGNWNGLPPDFQTGIDAAVFREANGKSYFFKGNRYVRLTETTVDPGYPASIAGNWNRLDAAFTSGLDAAMMHSPDKAIYFFKGAQSAKIVNGVPCLMSGNTPAVCPYTPAHLGWEAFLTGIDAALQRGDNDKTYLFSGKWYVRYSSFGQAFDSGYPTTIAANWRGLPASFEAGIDAAMWRGDNDKTYLFKGPQYVRLTGSTVDPDYPKPIAGNWRGIPASFREGIDAALWRKSNQKVYLFKGGQYVRLTGVTMDDGYPLPVSNWNLPDDWSGGIDAALMRLDTGQIYFFRGRRFIQMTSVSDGPDGGYPTWIDRRWMQFPRG
jgi:hypothetical protein